MPKPEYATTLGSDHARAGSHRLGEDARNYCQEALMKGKIGLVVGLGAGYVLGSRAGRQRYEQIKRQWLKVWHLDPVQDQVARVQDLAKAGAAAVPGVVWNGAMKVARVVTDASTPGHRLDGGNGQSTSGQGNGHGPNGKSTTDGKKG